MAHLRLFKEGTVGGQDGIEILPGDNILAEILAPTYLGAARTTFGLFVRCDTGFTVPQLIITPVRDPDAAALFGGRVQVATNQWNHLTDAAFQPFESGLLRAYFHGYGDSYSMPITSIEQVVTNLSSDGIDGSAVLSDIGTTNQIFFVIAFGIALEAGNYQDWSLNFSFTELAV